MFVTRGSWLLLLTVLALAELAGSLETTMVFAALPAAMREYGPSVSWLATGYLLVAGASAAVCGRLGDLFGRSRVLILVLGLATLGSVFAAYSNDLLWIVVGRAVQGLAGAVLPLGYGLARELLPAQRVPLATGALTAAASLGAALGFVLGGVIVDSSPWQHVFFWSAAIALFAVALCWILLPRSAVKARAGDLDILGGVLFAPSIAALLMAVSLIQKGGLTGLAAGLSAAGAAGLILWITYELRHPQPLIDVRLLKTPKIALSNLAGVSVALGPYQILIFFPLLMQQPLWTGVGFGLSATVAGLLKLPSNIAAVVGASGAGVIASRRGGAVVVLVGAGMCTVAWSGLLFDVSHLPYVIAMLCLSSSGATIVLAGMASVVMAAVPNERTSEATGVTIVVRMIFQALGAAAIGALLARWQIAIPGEKLRTLPTAASFHAGITYIVIASLIGVVAALALIIVERRRVALGSTSDIVGEPSGSRPC